MMSIKTKCCGKEIDNDEDEQLEQMRGKRWIDVVVSTNITKGFKYD